jgi:uncharacterized protein (DUF2225 family)
LLIQKKVLSLTHQTNKKNKQYEKDIRNTIRNGSTLQLLICTTCVYYAFRTFFRTKIMKFKLKDANTKQEAILSLLDVQTNKPELLPNNTALTEQGLNLLSFQFVRDLYVKVKDTYYNSLDFNNRF